MDFGSFETEPEPNRRSSQSVSAQTTFKETDIDMQVGFSYAICIGRSPHVDGHYLCKSPRIVRTIDH
ncbi:hypothetical protein SAMCFNEI73_pB0018 (plasmid) [Sinorhizobium americanum]|uniref:Uncharacterized protein n=1 Tax=Sinorhizobium americanum TaxID=194963 RepID=A0A1L3LSZ6_9HYPH|nr:hypothetical protein SAMCCGM7_pB0019 [Sinorhizobium americanum CCGM7]APG93218.1 hypothetical protein SAMCFNEI73_pB0018 [Sinorhizobium americanum]OAP48875.1 hypothetical protein ATC00_12665 [Sinorhizobium americanum]